LWVVVDAKTIEFVNPRQSAIEWKLTLSPDRPNSTMRRPAQSAGGGGTGTLPATRVTQQPYAQYDYRPTRFGGGSTTAAWAVAVRMNANAGNSSARVAVAAAAAAMDCSVCCDYTIEIAPFVLTQSNHDIRN
ncbi:hypothetical protein PENTCL1PPCAC_10496, partial [Pristionchus entomophagus]